MYEALRKLLEAYLVHIDCLSIDFTTSELPILGTLFVFIILMKEETE